MRELFCSDSLCSQKRSLLGHLRGSGYFLEQDWYCSDRCLYRALTVLIRRSLELPTPEILIHRRGRVGAILIQKGLISREELETALARQQEEGGVVGEWLVKLTSISEADLMAALSEQQGVPWLAKIDANINKSVLGLLPKKLCLEYKIFPFEFNRERDALRVAAKSPIDGLLLYMLRKMLGYEIQFFIVSDQQFEEMLAGHLDENPDESTQEISIVLSPRAIGEMILKKAEEYRLRRVSVHFIADTFWVRFTQGRKWRDLFLKVPDSRSSRVNKFARASRHILPERDDQKSLSPGNSGTSVGM